MPAASITPPPSTGVDFSVGGFTAVDNRFLERGKTVAAMIRQNRGALTNLSPFDATGAQLWSPFAADQQPRNDLFAAKLVNGYWVTNNSANEGWWLFGAFTQDGGPDRNRDFDDDDFMILQSNEPFDNERQKSVKTVALTPVQTAMPFLQRVLNDQPLVGSNGENLVADPGALNYFSGRETDNDAIEWQLVLWRARKKAGKTLYKAEVYPLVKLTKLDNSKMAKKDSEAQKATFKVLPDPFYMIPDPKALTTPAALVPGMDGVHYAGDAWIALGGVPVLSASVPTATPTTTGKATLVFADPTGTGDPWVITAEASTDGGTTWTAAVLDTPNAVTSTGGNTTVKVKSLTAGSTKLRAKVTGTNGATATTPPSASVTIT